jgi:gamma-glutamyltranspeptidase / glutathione hydrolase
MSAFDRLCDMAWVAGPRVVASAHPGASAAGVQAFAWGGNAFDAALAACFAEHIGLPMKCGLAGDLVALFRSDGGPFASLVSVGPGCGAIDQGERLERLGPRSVGVPGAPNGYACLANLGVLDLDQLIKPALGMARCGTPWTRVGLGYLAAAADQLRRWSPMTPYLPGGEMPVEGDLLRLPQLGELLQRFALDREALFEGDAGGQLVETLSARGGLLQRADFKARPARESLPARASIGARTLLTTAAPTAGPRLAGLVDSALKPGVDLVDLVRMERREAKARGRVATDEGTSVVCAADHEGNAVVVVHSNSFPQFGSGVVLESGLVLNNRPGRGFDLEAPPQAPNAPRTGRTPATTLHAWALSQDDGWLMGATPGGVNQLPWNLQTLLALLGGATPAQAVSGPRWALNEADQLTAEPGSSAAHRGDAKAAGALSQLSAQQILALPRQGLLRAAADPRVAASAMAAY